MELKSNSESKLNILIVEDDPICGFLAEAALRNNYNPTIVTSGHDAIEHLKKQIYDVILMDINLNDPVMDGLRTMRTIRFDKKHNDTKILAVTASSDDKQWFLKQGFDGHYMKPIMEKEIIMEINKCIGTRVVPVKEKNTVQIEDGFNQFSSPGIPTEVSGFLKNLPRAMNSVLQNFSLFIHSVTLKKKLNHEE